MSNSDQHSLYLPRRAGHRRTARASGLIPVLLSLFFAASATAQKASPLPSATASASAAPTSPPITKGPPAGPNKAIVAVGASVAGASLIAGVVFTLLANAKTSAAREKNGELVKALGPEACARPSSACVELAGLIHDRVDFSNAAAWSFIAAGTLGAATIVYTLVTKSRARARMHVAPVMTAGGGGFAIGGNW